MTNPSGHQVRRGENASNSRGTPLAILNGVANSISPITLTNIRPFDRPLQDEWGIFDPQQAGLEALMRRLQTPAAGKDSTHEPPAPVTK
jgi:hypothetical protein